MADIEIGMSVIKTMAHEIAQEVLEELNKEKHDAELLDKVAEKIKIGCICTDYSCGSPFNKDCTNCSNYMIDYSSIIEVIAEMKGAENDNNGVN